MSRKAVLLVAILVVTTTFGGATATLGPTGTDAESAQSPPAEVVRQEQPNNTTVSFQNQTTDGTVVTVEQANLTDGGFVVIHDRSLLNGSVLDSVLGVSEYLEAGTHEDVTVTLDEPITESQQLLALAYRDTNDNQTFDFVESQGLVVVRVAVREREQLLGLGYRFVEGHRHVLVRPGFEVL